MLLRYHKVDGTEMEFELGDKSITIGRSPEADIVILDENASRLHCGIRMWDGDFYLKDLKSKNGTYVNNQLVDMVKLQPGDQIRVGRLVFSFEDEHTSGKQGTQTVLREMEAEMAEGKGYDTILHEIVEHVKPVKKQSAGQDKPIKVKIRKPSEQTASDGE